MLDEEGLEDYVESFYGLKDRDYGVSCSCGDGFFQITVQHFEEEEPDLEEVVDSIFEILALEEDEWEFEYDSFENHSTVQSSEIYEEVTL
jgi:hypothetical protein